MRTHVGQYEIAAPLGRGGMGVVYRGVHAHLGRQVAIKELAPELTQQPEFKERFFAEAKTQARLHHPNIVSVYDLIEDGGEFFIVMEFVAGEALDDRFKAAPGAEIALHEAIGISCQVLAALDYAHSEGVIHRDIKPSNIMITNDGRVKLTDFGIALLIGDKRLTASQSAIGTPTYMSPEQILRPREVDHRTDIYSTAVVIFELLAGRPPFDDETEYGIKKLHVETPPPDLSTLKPSLPPALVQAVHTALSKNPDDRFASAGLFLKAIQEATPGVVPTASTAAPVPASRLTTIEPVRAGTGSAPPPVPATSRTPSPFAKLLQGRNLPITLAAAAILVLAVGFGVVWFALNRTGGKVESIAGVDPAAMAPPPAAADSAPSNEGPAPTPTPGSHPDPESPEPSISPLAASLPTAASALRTPPPPVPEPVSAPKTMATSASPPHKPAPKPVAQAPKPEVAPPLPEPADAATEPAAPSEPEKPTDAALASGVDQFTEMKEVIDNIEALSEKAAEACDAEGCAGLLATRLGGFHDSAVEVRKVFRLATGTGVRALAHKVKFWKKETPEASAKDLQIKIDRLGREADEIDSLIGSQPPSASILAYWREIRNYVRRLQVIS